MTEQEHNEAISELAIALKSINEKLTNGNGNSATSWPKVVMEIMRTSGVPALMLLALIGILWQSAPKVVENQTTFVNSTIETQKKLAIAQEQTSRAVASIEEIASNIDQTSQENLTFMKQVPVEHKALMEQHEAITENQTVIIKTEEAILDKIDKMGINP